MSGFSNITPMPFTPIKQIILAVLADASTASAAFGAAASELGANVALVQNDGAATVYVSFTVGVTAVVPGGVATSTVSTGQPLLAGMGMTFLLPPIATYANASSDAGVATVLRVSLGKGQ